MSLEQAIADLTKAVEANTAAMGKGATAGTAAASGKGATAAGKGATAAAKPKHTREEMVASLTEVKEKFDIAATRELFAPAAKMADIAEADIDKVYDKAVAKLATLEEAGGDAL